MFSKSTSIIRSHYSHLYRDFIYRYHKSVNPSCHATLRTRMSSAMGPRVCVVGGGVAGLTCSLRILQEVSGAKVEQALWLLVNQLVYASFHFPLNLVSIHQRSRCWLSDSGLTPPRQEQQECGDHTWVYGYSKGTTLHPPLQHWPFLPTYLCPTYQKMSDTPEDLTNRLAIETFDHLTRLFYSEDAVEAGVSLVQSHYLMTGGQPMPSWWALYRIEWDIKRQWKAVRSYMSNLN